MFFEPDIAKTSRYLTTSNLDRKTTEHLNYLQPWIKKHPFELKTPPGLLVVDVEQFFFNPNSPTFLPVAPVILERIQSLIHLFRRASLPVLFTQHVDTEQGPMEKWWKNRKLYPN